MIYGGNREFQAAAERRTESHSRSAGDGACVLLRFGGQS